MELSRIVIRRDEQDKQDGHLVNPIENYAPVVKGSSAASKVIQSK